MISDQKTSNTLWISLQYVHTDSDPKSEASRRLTLSTTYKGASLHSTDIPEVLLINS